MQEPFGSKTLNVPGAFPSASLYRKDIGKTREALVAQWNEDLRPIEQVTVTDEAISLEPATKSPILKG